MYKDHLDFEKPSDPNTKIWRFIDFTKFASLLETNSLFFARADLFPDYFEGAFTKHDIEKLQKVTNVENGIKKAMLKNVTDIQKFFPKTRFLNCWNINEHESAALWKIYTNNNEGVAIQSTFQKLTDSFQKTDRLVHVGKVKYLDYENESFGLNNVFLPFLHKRKSFEYENEIRAIVEEYPDELIPEEFEKISKKGIYIEVDLNILIERMYVAPSAQSWFKDLVRSILTKYGMEKPIVDSTLDQRPQLK